MVFCTKCGKELSSHDADVCLNCGKLVKESTQKRKEDKIWYLLPILIGIVGGIIAYLILKEDNPQFAKKCLMIGIILTIVSIVLWFVISALWVSMIYGNYDSIEQSSNYGTENGYYSDYKYEEAIKMYDQAIKIDPKNIDAWINKGLALEALGKYDEANKNYDEAIRINSPDGKAGYNKGLALEALGNYEEAEKNIVTEDWMPIGKNDVHEIRTKLLDKVQTWKSKVEQIRPSKNILSCGTDINKTFEYLDNSVSEFENKIMRINENATNNEINNMVENAQSRISGNYDFMQNMIVTYCK